jgi:hypothetical protein
MMKKRRPFNFTPFAELPPRQRRNLYVSLRWTITQEADKYGGKFTTHLMLDEPGTAPSYTSNRLMSFFLEVTASPSGMLRSLPR